MNVYQDLLGQVEAYVGSFYEARANGGLYYHHAGHAREVAEAAAAMARHYQLDERQHFVVMAAAWFLDAGYAAGAPPGHREARGAEIAEQFLTSRGLDKDMVEGVRNCILSTRKPGNPTTLAEQIVCDAGLFYLGSADFAERNKRMRKEAEMLNQAEISKDDWRRATIRLMETHRYFTDYGRAHLEAQKSDNLIRLMHRELEKSAKGNGVEEPLNGQAPAEPAPPGDDRKKNKRPERGIETVFRTTSSNNQQLSNQADNKAHIMIQVNAIVISVLLSIILSTMGEHRNLIIPIVFLLIVNVVTIIFAMLATRPTIPPGRFTAKEIETKKVNLLFFGNFYKMGLDEYTDGMLKMLDDYDFLYRSLIRDIYHQGVVLGKKYRLLRLSYSVFMYGLVASVIAFVAVFVIVQF